MQGVSQVGIEYATPVVLGDWVEVVLLKKDLTPSPQLLSPARLSAFW